MKKYKTLNEEGSTRRLCLLVADENEQKSRPGKEGKESPCVEPFKRNQIDIFDRSTAIFDFGNL